MSGPSNRCRQQQLYHCVANQLQDDMIRCVTLYGLLLINILQNVL